jgi:hypothetical protein
MKDLKTRHLSWTIIIMLSLLSLSRCAFSASFNPNLVKEDFNDLVNWRVSSVPALATTTKINPAGQLEQTAATSGSMAVAILTLDATLLSNKEAFMLESRVKCENALSRASCFTLVFTFHVKEIVIMMSVGISNGNITAVPLDSFAAAFPYTDQEFHVYALSIDNKAQTYNCLKDGVSIFESHSLQPYIVHGSSQYYPDAIQILTMQATSHSDYVYAGEIQSGSTFSPCRD